MLALDGPTAIETSTAGNTVKTSSRLAILPSRAVMMVEPVASVDATPAALIDAIETFDDAQTTWLVRSA